MVDKHCLVYAKKGGRPKIILTCEKAYWLSKGYVEQLAEVQNIDIAMVKEKLSGISEDLKKMQKKEDDLTAPYRELSQRLKEGVEIGLRAQSLEAGGNYGT